MKITNALSITFLALLFLLNSCKDVDENFNSTDPKKTSVPSVTSLTSARTAKGIFHTKGTALTSLDVISSSNLTDNASKVLVSTLQGLVAKTSGEQIYIDEGGATAVWKN